MLLLERRSGTDGVTDLLASCALSGRSFRFWQPLTYQFLHDPGSVFHLAGNMLFLWIFGSAVEGRIRSIGFVALYLAGGAVAGLVQLALVRNSSIIGASGSVSAVTGAFIVFFPRARVTVFLLLALVPMPAMLLVGIYLVLDFLGALGLRGGGVAYLAHLGGLAFGFGLAAALLGMKIVKRTDLDLLFLIRQWRRRSAGRRALRNGYDRGRGRDGQPVPPTRVSAAPPPPPVPNAAGREAAKDDEKAAPVANTRLADRLIEDATKAYANGEFERAADAYQRALVAAPLARDADQTRLMLAVIYGRKLKQPKQAGEFLRSIGPGLPAHLHELKETLRAEVRP
jgi:membrane associated rhomboid family serine protease